MLIAPSLAGLLLTITVTAWSGTRSTAGATHALQEGAGTDNAGRATQERDAPDASDDVAEEDWMAQRWPEIARVDELIAAGDLDGARAQLTAWVEPGLDVRCEGFDDGNELHVALRIEELAVTLGLMDVLAAARRSRHDVVVRNFDAEDEFVLVSKADLASVLQVLGENAEALVLQEHVHTVRERHLPPDDPSLLRSKARLASIRFANGDLAGALVLQEHVHAARVRLLPADHLDLLDAKNELAFTRLDARDLEGAQVLFEQVLAGWERVLPPDDIRRLHVKINLAGVRHALGDLEGARVLFEDALEVWTPLLPAEQPDLLKAMFGLAVVRRDMGDAAGARAPLEHVHAVFERQLPSDHRDLLHVKESLASAVAILGDIDRALALFEHVHAARARTLPAEHPELLKAKQNLACILDALGDREGALALMEDVLADAERRLPPGHPDRLSAQKNIAAYCMEPGDHARLRELCGVLMQGQIAAAATAALQAPRHARLAALRELERLEWIAFWSDQLEAHQAPGLAAGLVAAVESLRLVSTSSAETARAAAAVPELDAVRRELARVRRELADASQSVPTDAQALEQWRADLHGPAEQRDRLERELRQQLGGLGLGSGMPSAASIAAGLEEGGAFVGFWRYHRIDFPPPGSRFFPVTDSLLAFVVRRDGTVVRVELGRIAALDELVERWRATLGKPIERGLGVAEDEADAELAAGRALRAALVDPLLAALGDEAPRVLHVVPDDLVYLVPLDALPMEDETRLGETLEVRVDPSVARLIRAHRETESTGLLVAFGGVDFGAADVPAVEHAVDVDEPAALRSGATSFAPLLSSRLEAQFTATLYEEHVGAEPLLRIGKQASEAELVALAPQARHMHVATHGWFTPENEAVSMVDRTSVSPERDALELATERAQDTIVGFLPETLCGLALAGANHGTSGRLTAEELATLDLTNCELAVLSACETNVGIRRAGQGIQSLQTALHAAGARTAITSLWKVSDAATMRLFEIFYTKLWSENLGPADALWQAKMALRSEGHPTRDWAGWVLTGDPD
jgi:CHAT domain-containing protein